MNARQISSFISRALGGFTTRQKKARENRLRRLAENQGLRLTKARRSDPRALDHERRMIVDPHGMIAPVGVLSHGRPSMTLDEVDAWLSDEVGIDAARQRTAHPRPTVHAVRGASTSHDPNVIEHAHRFASEHGRDPSGLLHPFEVEAASLGVDLPDRYWELRPKRTVLEATEALASYRTDQDETERTVASTGSVLTDAANRQILAQRLMDVRHAIDAFLDEVDALERKDQD